MSATACFFQLERWPMTADEMAAVDPGIVDDVRSSVIETPADVPLPVT